MVTGNRSHLDTKTLTDTKVDVFPGIVVPAKGIWKGFRRAIAKHTVIASREQLMGGIAHDKIENYVDYFIEE
jgi:hypothetical protein